MNTVIISFGVHFSRIRQTNIQWWVHELHVQVKEDIISGSNQLELMVSVPTNGSVMPTLIYSSLRLPTLGAFARLKSWGVNLIAKC